MGDQAVAPATQIRAELPSVAVKPQTHLMPPVAPSTSSLKSVPPKSEIDQKYVPHSAEARAQLEAGIRSAKDHPGVYIPNRSFTAPRSI